MVKHLVLYSLVGLVMAGVLFARKRSDPAESADPTRAAPREDAEGVVHVGALRLWRDYDANAVVADELYKDRTLRVTGQLLGIDRMMGGPVMLDLASGNAMFRTLAEMDSAETPRVASFSRGDVLTLECIGRGTMMRMPLLGGCYHIETVARAPR